MAHFRLSTFFESYDNHDANAMSAWVQGCLKSQPQMVVEVFCACVEDPEESVAVDFMLNQMSNNDQWELAVHLFKEKKDGYFYSLLPKLSDQHSHYSFSCIDYILFQAVNTQDTCLLQAIIPHITKSSQCDWEDVISMEEVNDSWKLAMDKAVEKGWFEVVKTILPHTTEDARFIPALTAIEWQRKDYLEYIFTQSSFEFSVGVALFSIGMQKCKNMARYILNTYPQIVESEQFIASIANLEQDQKQWVEKYLAQKQRTKISSAVRKVPIGLKSVRKM